MSGLYVAYYISICLSICSDPDPAWVARARQIVEAGGPHGTVMIGG